MISNVILEKNNFKFLKNKLFYGNVTFEITFFVFYARNFYTLNYLERLIRFKGPQRDRGEYICIYSRKNKMGCLQIDLSSGSRVCRS